MLLNRKNTENSISQQNICEHYDFLVSSWVVDSTTQRQTRNSEQIIDSINKKVMNIHKSLNQEIDLQNISKSLNNNYDKTNSLFSTQVVNNIRKKVFLLQENRKTQQEVIFNQNNTIRQLNKQINKLKQRIKEKDTKLSILTKKANLNHKNQFHDYQLSTQTSTSSSQIDWCSLTYNSKNLKVVVYSSQISKDKFLETNKSLSDITNFLQKKILKQSSLSSFFANEAQINCSKQSDTQNFKSENIQSSGLLSKNLKIQSSTQLRLNPHKVKKLHRSPVFQRVQMLKKRLSDRYY